MRIKTPLAALAICTLLVVPAQVSAGTYTVRGCEAGSMSMVAFKALATGHLGPFGPNANGCINYDWGFQVDGGPMDGLWYRGDAFGWTFNAPPGTHVEALRAEVSGLSGSDRVTIAAPWFRGFWEPSGTEEWRSGNQPWQWETVIAEDLKIQQLAFGLRCTDAVCQFPGGGAPPVPPVGGGVWRGDYSQVARVRDIVLRVRDDEAPKVQPVRDVPSGWRAENSIPVTYTASDNVGVSSIAITIDGVVKHEVARSCDRGENNVERQPCGDSPPPIGATLEVAGLSDGLHSVVATVTDVAGNTTSHQSNLLIDHKAPGAVREVALSGTREWRPENRFALNWQSPPDDESAPVDTVVYQLCPTSNRAGDESGCVKGERSGASLSRIDDLAVPGGGAWRIRMALRDAAGNVDWDRSATMEPLRFDGVVPMAAFLPFDPADPATLRLATSDDASGVASVEVEVRRRGDATWHGIDVKRNGDQYGAAIDDDQLSPGLYEARARVRDHAGNERSTTTLGGGEPMVMRLPIRAATALAVGEPQRVRVKSAKSKRPRYKRVLVAKPEAEQGEIVSIEGKLTDEAGNPRPAAAVEVLEKVDLPGRQWKSVTVVYSAGNGLFKFRALPGPARTLRFVYPGTATTRPRSEDVELQVRARVTLAPSLRAVRNGDDVVFRGRLVGGPLPETGKLLALQAKTGRGWRTFATPRARAGDGRFSSRYRFTGTPVTARYAFRVVVPKESGYPYAWGASKVTTVLVHGG